jgi:hypothetical protein
VEAETDRLTVPENPPRLMMVTSDEAWIPAWVLIDDAPLSRKSTTFTDTIIEWEREPDVAITEKLKDPARVEVTVSVEVPEPLGAKVTPVGFRLAALLDVVRVTTLLKLLRLVRVRMVLLDKPAWTVRDDELAEIV